MDEDSIFVEPPNYYTDQHIFDINFHPKSNFIACSTIGGETRIIQYSEESITEIWKEQIHKGSCRTVLFSPNGTHLASGGQSGDILHLDSRGTVIKTLEAAHNNPIYSLLFLNENLICSGDDNGAIRIWDLRTGISVYSADENKGGTATGLAVHSSKNFLLSTSSLGFLSVFDLRKGNSSKNKLYAMSDQMEDEYNCLQIMENEQYVICGTMGTELAVYRWDWFGDSKDRIPCGTDGVDSIAKKSECLMFVGGEDGWIRAVSLYPNKVKIFQKHAQDLDHASAISKLAVSHCKNILASIGHDLAINFYDISQVNDLEFEEDEEVSKLFSIYEGVDAYSKNDPKREQKMVKKARIKEFFDEF